MPVFVGRGVPFPEDRWAIVRWAFAEYPKLVRSQYASIVWGRGGRYVPGTGFWPAGCGWHNAGVRVVRRVALVENSRGRRVAAVPLAEVALPALSLVPPPGWAAFAPRDATGLLVYADWLDENGHGKDAAQARRWAEEMAVGPGGG